MKYELYYSTVFFAVLRALGADIGTEIETNKGRVDAILKTAKHTYIIEFKYNQTADVALSQIHTTGYADQFKTQDEQTVHLLGINFSKEEKNIDDWKEEIL